MQHLLVVQLIWMTKFRSRVGKTNLVIKIFCVLALLVGTLAQPLNAMDTTMREAAGEFDVKMTPAGDRQHDGLTSGLFLLEKTFRGDLIGTSLGEVLTGMGTKEGSASYVAMEKVEGSLHGLEGSFILVHKASMSAAGQTQDISVVPDSGTGGLVGIRGSFVIHNDAGKHTYWFEYSLPPAE